MNILYFHQHFCTPDGSSGVRSYAFAKRWVEAGHRVTVITGISNDPTLKTGQQTIDGITVRCIGARYSNNQGFLARIVAFLRYAFTATFSAIHSREYDVVLATSTPLTVAIPALAAKWFTRRKVVFEVRDVWPDAAIDAGVLKNNLLIWLASKLEIITYQTVDHIVPLSTGMADNIHRKGIAKAKMTMLPNCSDLEWFDPAKLDRQAIREELDAQDTFIVLYVGAISLANDMPFLVKTMHKTKDDPSVCWWFVGSGNRLDYLRQQAKDRQIGNVVFWGEQPKAQIPRFVRAADVGIVSFINEPTYFENSPNKFFDYSAGGLPAIFTRTTWLAPYLETHQSGFVCNTPDECVAYIQQLRTQPSLREQMGNNARTMAEQEFSRDDIANRYLTLLQNILESASPADMRKSTMMCAR